MPRTAWSYRFDDADVRERTAILEATIRAGGCEGEPLHTQIFGRDEEAAMPPALGAGTYGLELVARDAACVVTGQVCETIVAGESAELVLTIARTQDGESCGSGEICNAGRCEVGECGCVDEAGTCRAGTERSACGVGGGPCEVCCGGGSRLLRGGRLRAPPVAARRGGQRGDGPHVRLARRDRGRGVLLGEQRPGAARDG